MTDPYPALWIAGTAKSRIAKAKPAGKLASTSADSAAGR
jgi:hypothetical protein